MTDICDFGNSYLFFTGKSDPDDRRVPGHMPWNNTLRIQLDSRCRLIDDESGKADWFYLIMPCRTEWMYRADVLWQQPNHEFCGFWSNTEVMAGHVKTGDFATLGGDLRTAKSIEGRYRDFSINVRHYPRVERLDSDEQVVQATLRYLPIIARTELRDGPGMRWAVIEYSVKTMNVQLERNRMQVDTGPLPFPDLARPVEREIERLTMAYICYNTRDIAEFILRTPTPVMRDGQAEGSVIDYSEVRRLPVTTTLYCAGQM